MILQDVQTYFMSVNGLPKQERLKLKNDIIQLFEAGESLYIFPLSIRYKKTDSPTDIQVSFSVSVPKKKIKLAVHRNRIKRKIRECYRVNKHELVEYCRSQNICIHLMVIFSSNQLSHIEHIERSLFRLLNDLKNVLP